MPDQVSCWLSLPIDQPVKKLSRCIDCLPAKLSIPSCRSSVSAHIYLQAMSLGNKHKPSNSSNLRCSVAACSWQALPGGDVSSNPGLAATAAILKRPSGKGADEMNRLAAQQQQLNRISKPQQPDCCSTGCPASSGNGSSCQGSGKKPCKG